MLSDITDMTGDLSTREQVHGPWRNLYLTHPTVGLVSPRASGSYFPCRRRRASSKTSRYDLSVHRMSSTGRGSAWSVTMMRTLSSDFASWFSGKSFVENDAHSWV